MDSQVEQIKKKLDAVDVIGRYLPLKKRGRHYVACCPFHGEKTPSFTVSPELQIFKCFGCGKAGDIFTFVQEFDHLDFRDALEELAKMAGITLEKNEHLSEIERRHKRLIDLNYEVAKFYNYILTSHPLGKNALDYTLNRGITLDTIKLFRLGFSPSNSSLISNYLGKKGFTQDELIATGTFGNSQYNRRQLYDRFQDRLVFPLCDFRDRVLGFSGRVLPGSKNANLAKYINSPETDLYHKGQMLYGLNLTKESIKKTNAVIVFEGEIDLISPYQIGVTNTVAIKGTAFTEDQLHLLKRYTDTLILGLDSDFAGNNSARKSIALADSLGFDIQVLSLGDKYKDPDEAVRGDPEFFKSQLEHTLPVWDFIIASALKAYDPATIRGKKDILAMVLPFLVKINNAVTRSDYYHKLASDLGSAVDAIVAEANKIGQTSNVVATSISTLPEPVAKNTKTENLEEYLLSLIFSAQKPHLLAPKIASQLEFTTPRYKNIFVNLANLTTDFDPKKFTESLSPELSPIFDGLYLSGTYLNLDSHHRLLEIKKTISQILTLDLKQKLTDLSSQIARAENSSQDDLTSQLEQEYNSILTQLSHLQSTKS